jgi:DNA processing protein
MARGIDSAAHRGCLAGKGRTVAVFGTGIDVIYPRDNQKLADQIVAQGGALVSEFAVGTFAAPQNFPIRNRIISGLAIGVLVVEAGEYSGTRITARCAASSTRCNFSIGSARWNAAAARHRKPPSRVMPRRCAARVPCSSSAI